MFVEIESAVAALGKLFFAEEGTKGTITSVRGLRNLGNTCFLNSVLQAVSSCPRFIEYVHSMSTLDANHTKFSSRLYSCLTEIRNSNNPVPYNPRFVRLLLAKFNPNFEGNDEQDALEAFESLLACMKGENEELVANLQTERRNGILNLSRSIVPTRLFCSAGAVKANSLSCPFEGWSSSHLECQTCIKEEGASAARWMATRHQVFSTLPLPIASSASGQLGVMKSAPVTAGCLPAGGDDTQTRPLRGGSPIAVSRSSSGGVVPAAVSSTSTRKSPFALHKFASSAPSIYGCLQEFFQAEDLSGISCSACSSAATLSAVQRKQAIWTHRGRKESDRFTVANGDADDDLTQQILSEMSDQLGAMRVKGERDALIADFDKGFIAHPLRNNEKETIVRMASSKRRDTDVMSAVHTLRLESDREMLRLSLRQPRCSDAVKRTSLSRLPPLLCLYLCRRTYDDIKGRMKKLVQHVSFPVLLNMDQFHSADGARPIQSTPRAFCVQDLAVGAAGPGTSITAMLRSAKKEVLGSGGDYLLRAVVEHRGTADTGHYVSYCLVNEQPQRHWELFSDEQHHGVAEEVVLGAQATMLFYEKISTR